VLGGVDRDRFGHDVGIALHAPEVLAVVGFHRAAPAGADRIDEHEVGEAQPGVRIIDELGVRRMPCIAAEIEPARADKPEIEKRRRGARTAVEHEGERAFSARVLRDVGCVKNRGDLLAGLAVQRDRAGRGRIGQLALRRIDRMLGDGIAGQKPEHAFAGGLLLLTLLFGVRGRLRERWRGSRQDGERDGGDTKQLHTCS